MIETGMSLPEQRIGPISRDAMRQVALSLDDPNPIHFNAEAVRRIGLGDKPINQEPNGMGYLLNLLIAFCGAPERVRRLQCRLRVNVFAGDELLAGGRVSDLDTPDVTCEVWLKRGQDVILSGTAVASVPGAGGNAL